jgi:hypothetical protein
MVRVLYLTEPSVIHAYIMIIESRSNYLCFYSAIIPSSWAGGVSQVGEYLPSKHEALSSNRITAKTPKNYQHNCK